MTRQQKIAEQTLEVVKLARIRFAGDVVTQAKLDEVERDARAMLEAR